jgi:osmotically-inducible protein OsmY
MNDASLKELVEEELEWEPSVDATDIGVGVEDGVVTLMGYVSSFTQKMAAERAASRVKGVRAIAQELEVRFAGMDTEADDRIAKRALDVLDWDVAIPNEAIKVKVQNGHVTLSGQVEWRYQANRARDKIDGLPGVKAVSNLIQIKPKVYGNDVKEKIEQALKRDAELEAKSIRVSVMNGKVTLEGNVHTWHDREVAEQAAWAAPGVQDVVDRIRIS